MKRELGTGRCGLACCLCSENDHCAGCRSEDCPDREWCFNRKCSIEKGIDHCYECNEECREGMLSKIKPLGFTIYAARYGEKELLDRLEENEKAGIVYHRDGINGDYDDFDDVEDLIAFIRTGRRNRKIEVKPLETEKEIKEKAYVHWKTWHDTYTGHLNQDYLDRLTLERCEDLAARWTKGMLVAKIDDKVVGFIGAGEPYDESSDTAEIFALYVLPEYQRMGIGTRLMDHGLERLKKYPSIGLWVLYDNQKAIDFYEGYGFEDMKEDRYDPAIDAKEIRMIYHRNR